MFQRRTFQLIPGSENIHGSKNFFFRFFFQKFMKFPKTAFGIVLLLICDPNMIAKQALHRSLFNLPKKVVYLLYDPFMENGGIKFQNKKFVKQI